MSGQFVDVDPAREAHFVSAQPASRSSNLAPAVEGGQVTAQGGAGGRSEGVLPRGGIGRLDIGHHEVSVEDVRQAVRPEVIQDEPLALGGASGLVNLRSHVVILSLSGPRERATDRNIIHKLPLSVNYVVNLTSARIDPHRYGLLCITEISMNFKMGLVTIWNNGHAQTLWVGKHYLHPLLLSNLTRSTPSG